MARDICRRIAVFDSSDPLGIQRLVAAAGKPQERQP
jgi:hypothetical protein